MGIPCPGNSPLLANSLGSVSLNYLLAYFAVSSTAPGSVERWHGVEEGRDDLAVEPVAFERRWAALEVRLKVEVALPEEVLKSNRVATVPCEFLHAFLPSWRDAGRSAFCESCWILLNRPAASERIF